MSELGNKHECLGCGTKFYDLGKSELVCPSCGENQKDLAEALDSPASKEAQRKKAAAKKKKKSAAAKKKKKKASKKVAAVEESEDDKKK